MLCIIQARMTSKRFKGKMLANLLGVTVLQSVVSRIKLCNFVTKIIVATSTNISDDKLVDFCIKNGIEYYRGSLENVASRFYEIILSENTTAFMRISGDSPLIDPDLIDKAIEVYNSESIDIFTNVFPRTFPKGQSIEIIKSKVFLETFNLMKTNEQLEHVTGYFYSNSEEFKIFNLIALEDYSDVNLCIDNPEDIEILEKVLKTNNYKPGPWKVLADSYRILKIQLLV